MVQLEKVYATDYINIEIDKEKSYIEITWLQQHTSDVYRQVLKSVTSLVANEKITRGLYDARERFYVEIGDQNWVMQEIIPLFNGDNLRLAYLVNPITLAAMDVYRVQDAITNHAKLKNCIQVETFLNKAEAQAWLLQ
jgi:hypothetical protein